MKRCRNCDWQPAVRRGRCNACSEYRRRTGRERPLQLVWRVYERRLERRGA